MRKAVQLRKKVWLALAVLLAGGAVAWQFRKVAVSRSESSGGLPQPAAMDFLPPIGPSGVAAERSPQPRPLTDSGPGAPPTAARPPQVVETTKWPSAVESGVPQLSTSFAGSMPHDPKPSSPAPDYDHADAPTKYFSTDTPGEQPTHKITDGDTLVRLAERYLGSGDRWRELFEYNRDVLSAPDLLPLGAELRIPPNVVLNTNPATSPAPSIQNVAITNAAAGGASDSALVPISPPPVTGGPDSIRRLPPIVESPPPSTNITAPIAPVAHALRVAPQTYTVQPRDTLATIAQKLYGDGRQANTLFEANRDRLKPGEEPPLGMILVVPTPQ